MRRLNRATTSRHHFIVSSPACAEPHGGPGDACTFQVRWAINPHMRVGAVDPALAVRQHAALVAEMRALGAAVELVPFVHGAYDSVFAKDAAILARTGEITRAWMAHPCHAERKAEQRERRVALEARGFLVAPPPSTLLEGGDVVVHGEQGRAYLGHGFRSSPESARALERFLGLPVIPLRLRDPALYHLDMALATLGSSTFVCEEALSPESMRELVRVAGRDKIIPVSGAEARRFALNFIELDGVVLLGRGVRSFEATLQSLGYTTRSLPLSEFQLAGGSAACLVARIHLLDRVAVRRTAAMRSTAA